MSINDRLHIFTKNTIICSRDTVPKAFQNIFFAIHLNDNEDTLLEIDKDDEDLFRLLDLKGLNYHAILITT